MRSTPPRPDVWDPRTIATAYVAFALVSTVLNIGAQQLVVAALASRTGFAMPASVLCGTVVGFASKYLLDKHLIFSDRSSTATDEACKVLMYALFSVATTALFWGCEFGAFYVIGGTSAKYAGAIVGLSVGYATKFMLDRRYTFALGCESRTIEAPNPV